MSNISIRKNIFKGFIPYLFACFLVLSSLFLSETLRDLYIINRVSISVLVLFFVGLMLRKAGATLVEIRKKQMYQIILISAGLSISGLSFWKVTGYFDVSGFLGLLNITSTQTVDITSRILEMVPLLGFVTLAFSSLFLYFTESDSKFVSGASEWLIASRLGIMLLVCFITGYVAAFRPILFQDFEYLPLVDWGLVAFFVWIIFLNAREKIERNLSTSTESYSWEVDVSSPEKRLNEDLVDLERAQEKFVEEGIKEDLIVNLVWKIQKSCISEEEIPNLLRGLVNYQDKPISFLTWGWMKNRIEKNNREARERMLRETMDAIKKSREYYLNKEG